MYNYRHTKNPWKVTFKHCFFVTYQLKIEKNIFTLIRSRHLVSHLLLTRKICHYHSASILLHRENKVTLVQFCLTSSLRGAALTEEC